MKTTTVLESLKARFGFFLRQVYKADKSRRTWRKQGARQYVRQLLSDLDADSRDKVEHNGLLELAFIGAAQIAHACVKIPVAVDMEEPATDFAAIEPTFDQYKVLSDEEFYKPRSVVVGAMRDQATGAMSGGTIIDEAPAYFDRAMAWDFDSYLLQKQKAIEIGRDEFHSLLLRIDDFWKDRPQMQLYQVLDALGIERPK